MEDDFSLLKVDYCELGVGETYSRYKSSMFAYKFRRGPAPLFLHQRHNSGNPNRNRSA